MFVLVIDDSAWHSAPHIRQPRTASVDPGSMVWVDTEDVQEGEGDGAAVLQRGTRHPGMRVFGPFETHEEGQLAASMLALDDDYRVVVVDQIGNVKPEP